MFLYFILNVFMAALRPDCRADWGIWCSRPFVCYQTCENTIFLQHEFTGFDGDWHNGLRTAHEHDMVNFGVTRSKVKVTRGPFWRHISRSTTIRRILTIPIRHMAAVLEQLGCKQAQLSQRDRATLRVIEYFGKSFSQSLKIIRDDTLGRCKSIPLKLCLYLVPFLTYSA